MCATCCFAPMTFVTHCSTHTRVVVDFEHLQFNSDDHVAHSFCASLQSPICAMFILVQLPALLCMLTVWTSFLRHCLHRIPGCTFSHCKCFSSLSLQWHVQVVAWQRLHLIRNSFLRLRNTPQDLLLCSLSGCTFGRCAASERHIFALACWGFLSRSVRAHSNAILCIYAQPVLLMSIFRRISSTPILSAR